MPSRKSQAHQLNAARKQLFSTATSNYADVVAHTLNTPLSSASHAAVSAALTSAESDPLADADQSPVPHLSVTGLQVAALQQPLRSAWATGLDLLTCLHLAPRFPHHCWDGDVASVHRALDAARAAVADGRPDAMRELLEGRFSMLRLTPLHLACQGARTKGPQGVPAANYATIVSALLAAGARVDSCDICGHTPLGNCAGFLSSPQSLSLVPLLVNHGADVNHKTRFGESLLQHTITSANTPAFNALLQVGADVNIADRYGLSPRSMAFHSPDFMTLIAEHQRSKAVSKMLCDNCGKGGASKYCAVCKRAYYCSKECQRRHWKAAHKSRCGKQEDDGAEYVDVIVGDMTTDDIAPGHKIPGGMFMNGITGSTSSRTMRMKDVGGAPFVVKVSKPLLRGRASVGSVKINEKNSNWLLVRWDGKAEAVHKTLVQLVEAKGIEGIKMYLSARWIERKQVEGKMTDVLRVDISRPLPTPKPLW